MRGERCRGGSEPTGEQVESLARVGRKRFGECIDVGRVRIFGQKKKKRAAQHGKRRDGVGITTASFVFAQTGVFSPVVADFNAAPVTTNPLKPLPGTALA